MGVWYTTREDVMSAPEFNSTARANARIGGAIEAASRTVETVCHRVFYPWAGTRYFDRADTRLSRLWFDRHDVLSLSTVVSGGVTILPSEYFLEPYDGPPYTSLALDRSGNGVFTVATTEQRSIALTGVFGYNLDETTAGALAEPLDATETEVQVSDGALVGVGHILRVDSERMIVTDRAALTSGQSVQGSLEAKASAVTVPVSMGSAFRVGESLLIDSERVFVVDIAGNNLTVKRAWDGSTLAAHTNPTVYTYRSLTVQRGVLGTTAATHTDLTALARHVVPAGVSELTTAMAVADVIAQTGGYADKPAAGLAGLMEQVRNLYGRQARTAAV